MVHTSIKVMLLLQIVPSLYSASRTPSERLADGLELTHEPASDWRQKSCAARQLVTLEGCRTARYCPNNILIAAVEQQPGHRDELVVLDPRSGTRLHSEYLEDIAYRRKLSWSCKGSYVACETDRQCLVFDMLGGKETPISRKCCTILDAHVAWSPEDHSIIACVRERSKRIELYNVATKTTIKAIALKDRVDSLSSTLFKWPIQRFMMLINCCTRYVQSCCGLAEKSIDPSCTVYDVAQGKVSCLMREKTVPYEQRDDDGPLLADGSLKDQRAVVEKSYTNASLSPDGSLCALAHAMGVDIYSVSKSPHLIKTIPFSIVQRNDQSLLWLAPDILCIALQQSVAIVEVLTGARLHTIECEYTNPKMSYSLKKRELVVCDGRPGKTATLTAWTPYTQTEATAALPAPASLDDEKRS